MASEDDFEANASEHELASCTGHIHGNYFLLYIGYQLHNKSNISQKLGRWYCKSENVRAKDTERLLISLLSGYPEML